MNPRSKKLFHSIYRSKSCKSTDYDLDVFDFTPEGMVLAETQEGVSLDEVIEKTMW